MANNIFIIRYALDITFLDQEEIEFRKRKIDENLERAKSDFLDIEQISAIMNNNFNAYFVLYDYDSDMLSDILETRDFQK